MRWRIHAGKLSLRQRHMRSLDGLDLPPALIGWIHERLEWAMLSMLQNDSEAVLVIEIDPVDGVRMSLDKTQDMPVLTAADCRVEEGLVVGADVGGQQQRLTGDVWLERDGALYASVPDVISATSTLCRDVAQTLGFTVSVGLLALAEVERAASLGSAFLISDEFGFIPIGELAGLEDAPIANRIREAFGKLW